MDRRTSGLRAISLTLAVAWSGQAFGQTTIPPGLPEVVASWIAGTMEECRADGGTPEAGPDYVRTADLNRDGKPDYVVHDKGLTCRGSVLRSCGSEGCSVEAFVWDGAKYQRGDLSSINAYEVVIGRKGDPAVLVLETREGALAYRWRKGRFVRAD